MNKIKSLERAINSIGLTQIAKLMSDKTGFQFSTQQINNWRTRGVPYKWSDQFCEISGVDKSKTRSTEQNTPPS